MRIHKIVNALCLVCVFISASVQAEGDSAYRNNYGIVDNVYSDESRMIIGDSNFYYGNTTLFKNAYGARVDDIKRTFKPGTRVSYYYYRKSAKWVLKELRVVSRAEFKQSKQEREMY